VHNHRIAVTTLGDHLLRAADRWPDNDAIVFPTGRWSYAELADRAYFRARSLLALGLERGDHVGVLMPNCLDYVELLFGIALMGGVAVPVNARYKAGELAYVVENADLKALVTNDLTSEYADFAGLLQAAFSDLAAANDPAALSLQDAPLLRTTVMLGAGQPAGMLDKATFEALAEGVSDADVDQRRVAVRLRDPCLMMYTSGTTANPKGCPLSAEALVRNGINMNRERYFLDQRDRFWAPLPMFHMSSVLPLLCCMDAGAAMLSMLRVDAGEALEMMEREAVTIAFPAFPTVTNELITHPKFATTNLSRLRRINNVAPVDVLRKFQEAFPQAVQTGAYGLTEAGGVISFNHPEETLEQRLHGCGQVFPGIEIKVVDPDTLTAVPTGERGEILIRGYCLFEGYYKAPEKNAESFVDGWFRTGDLCSVDAEGRIAFHGRLKDMLKVGGENVAALEIESFLARHPAVKLAQVVGVPDARLLEVAAAFIELNPGCESSEAELIEFCRGDIAGFKVPRYVRFVDEWPMSSTKVQKFRLRESFLEAAQRENDK
jgi:acyl-CoA synthetase (AMP-forming)/AMP-acid ligase II